MQQFPKFYVATYLEDKHVFGSIPEIGNWHNYHVYEIEDHLAVRLELLKIHCVPLPSEDVARAWKFADPARQFLVMRDEALEFYGISESKTEFYKPGKRKYTLTDEDKRNGLIFAKLVLRGELYRKCENIAAFCVRQSSRLYAEYAANRELSGEKPNEYPNLARSHDNRNVALQPLLSYMEQAEEAINSIANSDDVRRVSGVLFEMYNDIPSGLKRGSRTAATSNV